MYVFKINRLSDFVISSLRNNLKLPTPLKMRTGMFIRSWMQEIPYCLQYAPFVS